MFGGPSNEKVEVTGPPVLMTSLPVSLVSHFQTSAHLLPFIWNWYFFWGGSSFFSGSAARPGTAATARAARTASRTAIFPIPAFNSRMDGHLLRDAIVT